MFFCLKDKNIARGRWKTCQHTELFGQRCGLRQLIMMLQIRNLHNLLVRPTPTNHMLLDAALVITQPLHGAIGCVLRIVA